MAKTGRPTKGTPERMAAIVAKVAQGVSPEVAAGACGVSPATFYRWKSQGEHARRGPFREFRENVERAVHEAEAEAVAGIKAAAIGGTVAREEYDAQGHIKVRVYQRPEWTAYAWYLERAHRDRWGRTDRVDLRVLSEQVAGDEGLTDAEKEQLQQELAAFLHTNR